MHTIFPTVAHAEMGTNVVGGRGNPFRFEKIKPLPLYSHMHMLDEKWRRRRRRKEWFSHSQKGAPPPLKSQAKYERTTGEE